MYQFPRPSKVINYPQKRLPIRKVGKNKQRSLNVGKIFRFAINYVKIYFKHSSMHGLKYLVKRDISLPQKLLWLVILIVCHISCILIYCQSIERFRFKSTVMGVERDYHYWNTTVPSLTVCSMDRLNENKFEKYCNQHNITDEVERKEFFDFLESLANSTYFNFENIRGSPTVDYILKRLNILPTNYMELIYNLTTNYIFPKKGELGVHSTDGRVNILFRQVLTEYGICYMTNSILGLEYSAEYAIFGRYPQLSSNDSDAKNIVKGTYFDADVTIDFLGFPLKGVDSYIHSSFEVLRVDNNIGFSAETVQYYAFSQEMVADKEFESVVSISQRKCRFQHESNLTHFPLYSKNLCLQECRINMAMEKCECIPHFYPNRIPNPKPVCHYKILQDCFPKYQSNLLLLYSSIDGKKVPFDCHCLQNCVDTIVTLKKTLLLKATQSLFSNTVGVRMTVENWPIKRLKRQIVYSFTDLMVSFGGTAGLFLGFSVLSLVELIYFFTIRLFFHLQGIEI